MNRNVQYLSYVADCHLMACMTRDEHEREIWLEMAQSWLELVRLTTRQPFSPFERDQFGKAA